MTSFEKVDCNVITSLWKSISPAPAWALAGQRRKNTALAATGRSVASADPRRASGTRQSFARRTRTGCGTRRQPDHRGSALAQLREEGYLESRHGSGSRVVLPGHIREVPTRTGTTMALDLSTAALSAGPEIHQAYQQALVAMPPHLLTSGYQPQGLLCLRESLARHYCARGLPTTADEIMVVNGAVSGLALILRLLTGPGDRVVVDHPTYPLAIAAIQGASCRPVGVSLPEQGWDTDGLAATIAQTSPRMAYLMPDFHNPTGRCMMMGRGTSSRISLPVRVQR